VARSTRQQRRQRRAQQRPALAGGPPAPPAQPPARPVAKEDPEPRQPREPRAERTDDVRSGTRGIRFLQESWGELKKVEWPDQQALISGTAVVLIACLITGVYLYANDRVWEYVVKHVLLK
jgi:preprotein translocase SecE subunit